jgi:hypothetical protein
MSSYWCSWMVSKLFSAVRAGWFVLEFSGAFNHTGDQVDLLGPWVLQFIEELGFVTLSC